MIHRGNNHSPRSRWGSRSRGAFAVIAGLASVALMAFCRGETGKAEAASGAAAAGAPAGAPAADAGPPDGRSRAQKKVPTNGGPADPRGSGNDVVLLLTDPTPRIVKNYIYLVNRRIIDVPNLKVVGIYQEEGERQAIRSRRVIFRNGVDWISLKKVPCRVERDEVFRENGCTGEFRRLVDSAAGVIFSGGPDIPPPVYGEKTRFYSRIASTEREYFEISFLYHLLKRTGRGSARLLLSRPDFVVLGICMGMQAMNVALGGTLYQDIPSELYRLRTAEDAAAADRTRRHINYLHFIDPSRPRRRWVMHPVAFKDDRRSSGSARERPRTVEVVSAHHQAVKRLGEGLEALAFSLDGKVIEAVRHRNYPNVSGVQFHPDYAALWEAKHDEKGTAGEAEREDADARAKAAEYVNAFWRNFGDRLRASASRPGAGPRIRGEGGK